MAKSMSKTQIKAKRKQKKIKKIENIDAKGISRKKYKLVITPKTFFILKAIAIVLIPIAYFVYSPLLVLVMFLFVGLYFVAIGCEHSLNKSVIKSNHIKIPKYDSAIALLLICVSLFGALSSFSSGGVGRIANTFLMKLKTAVSNFGSLQTGIRSIFGTTAGFKFGPMEKPDGFIPNSEAFLEEFGTMPRGDFHEGVPNFEFSMDNIPIEFMFSQVFSTVATVLICMVGIFGAISLYYTMIKIRKFNTEQNEIIIDGEIKLLSDEEMFSILDFGEIEEQR
ncbi:MAG: hypothetical protein KJ971_04920 [Firmicutes bacterium]|nr:hypothetical protein [Bacillota bacterium]